MHPDADRDVIEYNNVKSILLITEKRIISQNRITFKLF